jgi:hypothetical protein
MWVWCEDIFVKGIAVIVDPKTVGIFQSELREGAICVRFMNNVVTAIMPNYLRRLTLDDCYGEVAGMMLLAHEDDDGDLVIVYPDGGMTYYTVHLEYNLIRSVLEGKVPILPFGAWEQVKGEMR